MTARIEVSTAMRDYEVVVGCGLLATSSSLLPALDGCRRALVVTDDNVAPLYLDTVSGSLREADLETVAVVVPHGETEKTLARLESLYGAFYEARLTRSDLVVALGGGVVGDLAGFAAATFQRGVRFVQMPTTLLAMVDASVGGKTGVDYREGKNYIGSFYQPWLVLADLETLATLPLREVRGGWAEVVKHGFLAGGPTLGLVERGVANIAAPSEHLIESQVACKAAVVVRDEREESGERAQLNLGHTIAHAVEAATGFARFTHGEAVGLGLRACLWLSERLCGLSVEEVERGQRFLTQVGLPERLERLDPAAVAALVGRDKKADGGGTRYVLLAGFGRPVLGVAVDDALQMEVLQWLTRR